MNPNYEKLLRKLHELFMLDQEDLDFGIYRIMNFRRDEIKQFIEQDLLTQVRAELDLSGGVDRQATQRKLDAAIKQAQELGVDPETTQKVKDLRAELAQAGNAEALENEVFSQLYNFFSRYYEGGDFVSLRRYKKDVYAIPYEGEEVKLHWANADQYYVKSSEYFKKYRFTLPDGKAVEFTLRDASTEQLNNKSTGNTERRFRLVDEDPVEMDGDTLRIYFNYLPVDKSLKRENLNKEAHDRLVPLMPADFVQALAPPPGKSSHKTLLEKHLNHYTARHAFDYFIHKDLGGFLNRELDFFIKNELLDIDEIDTQVDAQQHMASQFAKIVALKKIARKIIAFLASLEDFQRSLWLKKKFVTETQYCLTLDRIPTELYPEIAANERQVDEWIALFKIDQIGQDAADGFFQKAPFSRPLTLKFLEENPHLLLDTAYFDTNFKMRLLAHLPNLDAQTDGLLLHSDNFQALAFLQERYREQMKCLYIDPPYNTGGDGFFYKDNYRHSSWLSMIHDRLALSYQLLAVNGVLYSSIDSVERSQLEKSLDLIFGNENRVEEIIWVQNSNKNQSPTFSTNHEYVCVYSKDIEIVKKDYEMFREIKPGLKEVQELIERINPDFPTIDEIRNHLKKLFKEHKQRLLEENEDKQLELDDWKGLYNYNQADYRDENGKYVPEEEAKAKNAVIWVWREDNPSMPQVKEDSQKESFRDPESPEFRFYKPTHPITGKPCPAPKRGWSWPYKPYGKQANSFIELAEDNRISWGEDENKIPQTKRFLHEVETNVSKSVVNDYTDGEKQLTDLFGKTRSFSNPKPTTLITRFCVQANCINGICLDYFAGSGTTAHAVLNLNREDGGKRKYILVEQGEYFNTVLLPRIKKVVYSKDWKNGVPQSRDTGVSHCLKYLRLESYEDTLNNLTLERSAAQQQVLDTSPGFRESYLLQYAFAAESRASLSGAGADAFANPFDKRLRLLRQNEEREVVVDVVETFNYLLGLVVESTYAADGFRVVIGKLLPDAAGRELSVLIVWRNCQKKSAEDLNAFFAKQKFSPRDQEFDRIYVNGDHTLQNVLDADQSPKVVLIEGEFRRRMFEEL